MLPPAPPHCRKPFVAAANIDDKRQVVSTSYNTPIGLYSKGNIQDAMEGQIRGLVHQKPERITRLTHSSRVNNLTCLRFEEHAAVFRSLNCWHSDLMQSQLKTVQCVLSYSWMPLAPYSFLTVGSTFHSRISW
ncbi:hypothetical protein XENOCAPTIV_010387 [Xenoophorus captivus]|uniref:Zasp-like motif domain-containing protein n=1 Tax=Xenoophorus captivus TaxID=1517983 RepID=A0ABV0QD11_9TELE